MKESIVLNWRMPESKIVCGLDFETFSEAKKFAQKHLETIPGIWWEARKQGGKNETVR